MYLWRNLPEGQLLAVLRWIRARREEPGVPAGKPAESCAEETAVVPTPTAP